MPLKSSFSEACKGKGKVSHGLGARVLGGEVELFSDTFDPHGDFSKWTAVINGAMTIQDIIKHSGTYAARCESIPHDGFDFCYKNLPALSPYSMIKQVMYLYIDSLDFVTAGETHSLVAQANGSHLCGAGVIKVAPDYKWALIYDNSRILTLDDLIVFGRWYKVELRTILSDIPDDSIVSLYLDDVLKATSPGWLFRNSRQIGSVAFGNCWGSGYGSTFTPIIDYGDDVRVVGVP